MDLISISEADADGSFFPQYTLISTTEEAQELFETIICKKEDNVVFGFDMEADDMGNYRTGSISLIQIKIKDKPPYILDIYGSNIDLGSTRFNDLMKSEEIETIVHDPRNDSRMLYEKYKTEMRRVFDPQSFHMTVENKADQIQTTRRLQCKRKPLEHIYEAYVKKTFPCKRLKSDMKTKMKDRYQKLWLTRPLTRDMAAYAALDVETLLPIYNSMNDHLTHKVDDKSDFLRTFNELCAESIYTPNAKVRFTIAANKRKRENMEVKRLEELNIPLSKEEKKILVPSTVLPPSTRRPSQTATRKSGSTKRKQQKKVENRMSDQDVAPKTVAQAICEDQIYERNNLTVPNEQDETEISACMPIDKKTRSPTRTIASNLQKLMLKDVIQLKK